MPVTPYRYRLLSGEIKTVFVVKLYHNGEEIYIGRYKAREAAERRLKEELRKLHLPSRQRRRHGCVTKVSAKHNQAKPWVAKVTRDGRSIHIGYFHTKWEAERELNKYLLDIGLGLISEAPHAVPDNRGFAPSGSKAPQRQTSSSMDARMEQQLRRARG